VKQTLQLKLSQHLTLTPQLQQSIRLLQLSTLELNAEVERILQENPLLEREETDETTPGEVTLAGPGRVNESGDAGTTSDGGKYRISPDDGSAQLIRVIENATVSSPALSAH